MRKCIALLLLLTLLSCAALVTAHAVVDDRAQQVEYKETVLHGDPANAAGTAFRVKANSSYHLHWDTTYTVGAPEKIDTDFDYTTMTSRENEQKSYGSIDFYAMLHFGMSSNGSIFEQNDEKQAYLEPAKDIATRCSPDSERTEVVRLADYYDYIPLDFNVRLSSRSSKSYYFTDEMRAKAMSYFQIPVPDDLLVEVTVHNNALGVTDSVNYTPYTEESIDTYYYFDSYSAVAQDAGYILVSNRADDERMRKLDFSSFAEGFGIYIMPIVQAEDGGVMPDVDAIHNAYPMDEGTTVVALELSDDEQDLLLYTRDKEGYTLTVINRSTMKTRQIIELLRTEEKYIRSIFDQGELIAFILNDAAHTTVVLQKDEENYYRQVTQVELGEFEEFCFGLYDYPVFDCTDGKLNGISLDGQYANCTVYLGTWEGGKLTYAGKYESSLNTADGLEQGRYEPNCASTNVPIELFVPEK